MCSVNCVNLGSNNHTKRNFFLMFYNCIVITEELAETEIKRHLEVVGFFLSSRVHRKSDIRCWLHFLFDWCFFFFCPGHNPGLQEEHEYWDPPPAF